MELSSSNIKKKNMYISSKESYSYILGNETQRFSSLARKKNPPRENSLYFRKWNFIIFQERYIRTLTYLEPEKYSET